MSSYQKIVIVGNLGADPEMKYLPSGGAVVNISVATSERWKDKQTGEQKEKTEWHRCAAFNRTAEVIGEYLHKGSKVLIEGKMQTRKWQDKEGNDRYSTEVMVDRMVMLDSKGSGQGQGGGQQNRPAGAGQGSDKPAGDHLPADDDFDDDIPF